MKTGSDLFLNEVAVFSRGNGRNNTYKKEREKKEKKR